eukprot:10554821-Prorocentrum_lima.AAC.1
MKLRGDVALILTTSSSTTASNLPLQELVVIIDVVGFAPSLPFTMQANATPSIASLEAFGRSLLQGR